MRRDDGSVLIHAIGGVLLVLTVTLVLADTSSLFMRRTALMMIADDAAIAAAGAIDVEAIYEGGVGTSLPLDPALARALAQQAVDASSDSRLSDVRLDEVEVTGDIATVLVSARVPAPLSGITGDRTVRLRVAASAGTPTRF